MTSRRSRSSQTKATEQLEQRLLPRGKWTANAARVGAQLSDHQPRFDPGDESAEGTLSRLGHSLRQHPGLCRSLSGRVVEQDPASRCAPARRAALSTAGWIAGLAAKPATRVFGREPVPRLLHLRVLRLGFLQDGDGGVGWFPRASRSSLRQADTTEQILETCIGA